MHRRIFRCGNPARVVYSALGFRARLCECVIAREYFCVFGVASCDKTEKWGWPPTTPFSGPRLWPGSGSDIIIRPCRMQTCPQECDELRLNFARRKTHTWPFEMHVEYADDWRERSIVDISSRCTYRRNVSTRKLEIGEIEVRYYA